MRASKRANEFEDIHRLLNMESCMTVPANWRYTLIYCVRCDPGDFVAMTTAPLHRTRGFRAGVTTV